MGWHLRLHASPTFHAGCVLELVGDAEAALLSLELEGWMDAVELAPDLRADLDRLRRHLEADRASDCDLAARDGILLELDYTAPDGRRRSYRWTSPTAQEAPMPRRITLGLLSICKRSFPDPRARRALEAAEAYL